MIITQIPVLKLIVEYIDSNLDRICFVLTCKDLFDKRNKILTIKPEVLDHDMQHYFMEFKMKSFLKKTYEQVKALSKISSVDVDVPNVSGRYTGPIRYYQPDFKLFQLDHYIERPRATSVKQRISYLQSSNPPSQTERQSLANQIGDEVTDLEYCYFSHWLVDFERIQQVQSIQFLTLPNAYNEKIRPGQLPPRLLYLQLGISYSHPFQFGLFPETLERLIIGTSYNHPLEPGVLPSRLKTLKFLKVSYFDHPLQVGSLPNSLMYLIFGGNFNQPITSVDILPQSLIALDLGTSYNHPLFITNISIGDSSTTTTSTQKKDKDSNNNIETHHTVLPRYLKYLVLGKWFSQQLDANSIHPGITHLALSNEMYKNLSKLPSTVRSLAIIDHAKDIVRYIPKFIEELHFDDFKKVDLSKIPDSVQRLSVYSTFFTENKALMSKLPKSIQSLRYAYAQYAKSMLIEIRRISSTHCLILSEKLFGGITKNKDIDTKINTLMTLFDGNINFKLLL